MVRVKGKTSKGGVLVSESEYSEEMMEIQQDFITIHGEVVLKKTIALGGKW